MRPNPMSTLGQMRADFIARGWAPTDLDAFRMEDGDGDGAGDGDDDDTGAGDDDPKKTEDLGEKGKQALAKERAKAKAARDALKPWTDLAAANGMTLEQVQEAISKKATGESDPKVIMANAQRDADAKANATANARVVRAEVKVAAADLFEYPADAHLYLDLTKYDVDDAGDVDLDEIVADLKEVLKTKPRLAKNGKAPKPDPTQGSKGDGKKESTPGIGRMRDAYADSAKTKK